MRESSLLPPYRFRFGEPDDAKAYGDDWHLYDEAQIVRLPVRELVKLETELGMPILDVFTGMRAESVLGYLGGTWLALRLVDPALAGAFDAYTPVAMLIEWDRVPAGEEPPEAVQSPLDPSATTSSPLPE